MKRVLAGLLAWCGGVAAAETLYVVNLNASGPGSLAAAIETANTNNAIDAIYFADELTGEILLTHTLEISEGLDLVGPGADRIAISGGSSNRIFLLSGSFFGKISGLTLRNGNAGAGAGGAIHHSSPHSLSLEAVLIENCSANQGGAIYSGAHLAVERSTLAGCSAVEGGAIYLAQNPLVSDPFVTLKHATLFSNRASSSAGAVYLSTNTANLFMIHATLHDNRSATGVTGDTIHVATGAPTNAVEMVNSVISDVRIPILPPATLLRGYPASYALLGINYIGSSALLREPALHGYPVPVCMPELDSPLIDAANVATPYDDVNNFDARFNGLRTDSIAGPHRDLGAVEVRRFAVTSTNDAGAGSLRAAITNVNVYPSLVDYLILPNGVIKLTNALPTLSKSCIITGGERPAHGEWLWPRTALYTEQPIRLLTMTNHATGRFWLEHLEFRGGRTDGAGAAVLAEGPGLFVRGCSFIENRSTNSTGGAISATYPGPIQVQVDQSLFIGQESVDGAAAVFAANTSATGPVGRVTVRNSIFAGNNTLYGSLVLDVQRAAVEVIHATFDANARASGFSLAERGVVSAHGTGSTLAVYNSAFTRNVTTNQQLAPSWFSTGATNLAANHVGTNALIYLTDFVFSPVEDIGAEFPGRAYVPSPLVAAADPARSLPRDFYGVFRSIHGAPDIGAGQRFVLNKRPGYNAWIDLPCHPRERIGVYGPFGDIDGDGFGNGFELVTSSDPFTPDEPDVRYYMSNTVAAVEVGVQIPRLREAFGSIYIDGTTNLLGEWSALNVTGYGGSYAPDGTSFSGNYASVPHGTPWHYHRATLIPEFILPITPCLLGVGLPGNAADTNALGSVAHAFAVGAHEVTVAEYVQFLNAVDESGINYLGLWNPAMATNNAGSILLDTNAPYGARYRIKAGRAWFPVNYVTYYNALAYCNWMTIGTTESGAYDFNLTSPPPANTIERQYDADYVLPTADEWYKAAYFVNDLSIGGLGLYSRFPLRANSSNYNPPPGTTNSANLPLTFTLFPGLQEVGSYPSAISAFGAWDMAGNVKELIQSSPTGGVNIVVAGGGYADSDNQQARSDQTGVTTVNPNDRRPDVGFRVIKLR